MNEIKVTTKLVVTIIIVSLFFLFWFELMYNKLMYQDYQSVYDELIRVEDRVDKLMEVNIQLQNVIIQDKINNNTLQDK